jgi:hypothetical protein
MEIDVAERVVSQQNVVGATWTSLTHSSQAILPVVTTEHRVQVFHVSRAAAPSVPSRRCLCVQPAERRCTSSWSLPPGTPHAFTAPVVQHVRTRKLWAVQDERLLVVWNEADKSIDTAPKLKLSASVLTVLVSRFLDTGVVVHRNGRVSLFTAQDRPGPSGPAQTKVEQLASTTARSDGRRITWSRLVALKGAETGTYLLFALAQPPTYMTAAAAEPHLPASLRPLLLVYRIVSRHAASLRSGSAATGDSLPDASIELCAEHSLTPPPGASGAGSVMAACVHKALLRISVLWAGGALQALAFPLKPLWYLSAPSQSWVRELDHPQRAIEKIHGRPPSPVEAHSWNGTARVFAVDPGCLVLVTSPKALTAGLQTPMILSVWDARHGVTVGTRITTVGGDQSEEASLKAVTPSPLPRSRKRRSSSIVDPSILTAQSSAASTAAASDPLVTATIAADGSVLCVAAAECVTLSRLTVQTPSLAAAFGQVGSTLAMLSDSDPMNARFGSVSLPPVMNGAVLFMSDAPPAMAATGRHDAALSVPLASWGHLQSSFGPAGRPEAHTTAAEAIAKATSAEECRRALKAAGLLGPVAEGAECPYVIGVELTSQAVERCAAESMSPSPEKKKRTKRRRRDSVPSSEWKELLLELLERGFATHRLAPMLLELAASTGNWDVVESGLRNLKGIPERALASTMWKAVRKSTDSSFVEWVCGRWEDARGVDILNKETEVAKSRQVALERIVKAGKETDADRVAASAPLSEEELREVARARASGRGLEHLLVLCSACDRNDVFLQRALSHGSDRASVDANEAVVVLVCLNRLIRRFGLEYLETKSLSSDIQAKESLPPSVVALLCEDAVASDSHSLGGGQDRRSLDASTTKLLRHTLERHPHVWTTSGPESEDPGVDDSLAHHSPKRSHIPAEWDSPLPDTPVPSLGRLLDWVRILLDAAFSTLMVGASTSDSPSKTLEFLRGTLSELMSSARSISELRGLLAHTMLGQSRPAAQLPDYLEVRVQLP